MLSKGELLREKGKSEDENGSLRDDIPQEEGGGCLQHDTPLKSRDCLVSNWGQAVCVTRGSAIAGCNLKDNVTLLW